MPARRGRGGRSSSSYSYSPTSDNSDDPRPVRGGSGRYNNTSNGRGGRGGRGGFNPRDDRAIVSRKGNNNSHTATPARASGGKKSSSRRNDSRGNSDSKSNNNLGKSNNNNNGGGGLISGTRSVRGFSDRYAGNASLDYFASHRVPERDLDGRVRPCGARVTLGPIMGEVTETTARILYEFDADDRDVVLSVFEDARFPARARAPASDRDDRRGSKGNDTRSRGMDSRGGGNGREGNRGGNSRGSYRGGGGGFGTDTSSYDENDDYYYDDGGGSGLGGFGSPPSLGRLVAQARRDRVTGNVPAVFCVSGLSPLTRYVARVESANSADVLLATFGTVSTDPTALRIACFSCDKIKAGDHDRMWGELEKRAARGDVDLFLHLGDQVYADSAYKECAQIVKSVGLDAARRDRDTLVEKYRAIYRKTFSCGPTARVYATGSHLMIWDDHELVNDWGTPNAHRDKSPSNVRYFLGTIARQAYCEYQKQLWDNVDLAEVSSDNAAPGGAGAAGRNGAGPVGGTGIDAHTHVYGSIGILFLDLRGGRSFHHEPGYDMDFLGRAQWDLIHEALRNGGEFSACRCVVVATSIPLAYSSAVMSQVIGTSMPWVRDKMGFGLNRPEQSRLFKELQAWKDNMAGREIVAVAGDMHATCEGLVLRGGDPLLTQVVCSPIANRPPTGFKFWWMKFMSGRRLAFWGGEFTYRRTKEWVNKRNFTILSIDTERMKGNLIEWETVTE